VLLAAPALALAPAGERIDFRVPSETRLVKSFKHAMHLELSSMGMSLNGVQIPPAMLGELSIDIEEELQATMIDEYLEVDGDQPVRIRRSFETLANGGRRSAKSPREKRAPSTNGRAP
jgi:antitoxin component of MazEF toxin-antitoxin module